MRIAGGLCVIVILFSIIFYSLFHVYRCYNLSWQEIQLINHLVEAYIQLKESSQGATVTKVAFAVQCSILRPPCCSLL